MHGRARHLTGKGASVRQIRGRRHRWWWLRSSPHRRPSYNCRLPHHCSLRRPSYNCRLPYQGSLRRSSYLHRLPHHRSLRRPNCNSHWRCCCSLRRPNCNTHWRCFRDLQTRSHRNTRPGFGNLHLRRSNYGSRCSGRHRSPKRNVQTLRCRTHPIRMRNNRCWCLSRYCLSPRDWT